MTGPEGRVLSANHETGKIHFTPGKLIYFPGEVHPNRKLIDYSLTMCSIYG